MLKLIFWGRRAAARLKKRPAVALFLVFTLAWPGLAWAAPRDRGGSPGPRQPAAARGSAGYVPGEVLVKYKSGATVTAKAGEKARLGLRTKRAVGRGRHVELLQIQDGAGVEAAIAALKRGGLVDYAEPNYIRHIAAAPPNDPRFADLWGLANTAHPGLDVGILDAWDATRGDPGLVVGVTDTGIDINHPDLRNRIWTNPDEIPDNGLDDDNNGRVDDVNGWDFYWNVNYVYDPYYDRDEQHGTHVAGTIAAEADNATGIAGVAPDVRIMPLKVCGFGGCTDAAAAEAIYYAMDKGVRVINASWGGPDYGQTLYDAIAAFGIAGGLFVAAAGNEMNNNDVNPIYPASFSLPNIISVAAVDSSGNLAIFSNYGQTTVDVGAPGVDILSTIPKVPDGPAAVTVADAAYGYRAVVWGFGAERFTVQQAVYDAVQRAMDSLGAAPGAAVLVVDDDESGGAAVDVRGVYLTALADLGYHTAVYEVAPSMSGPGADIMAPYAAVAWFTGEAYGDWGATSTLTPSDEENLRTYLGGGGKLFLSGQDALFGSESSALVTDYLHISWLGEWNSPSPDEPARQHSGLAGVPGGAYDGADYTGQWAGDVYYDFLDSNDPAATVAMSYIGDPDYNNAYESWQGTSMAAPHVAGTVALLLSHRPAATVAEVVSSIKDQTTRRGSLIGKTVTRGIVSARKALAAIDGAPVLTVGANPAAMTSAGDVTITVMSSEALSAAPAVTVTPPGGNAQAVTMVSSGANTWAGTYAVTSDSPDGAYTVSASGTDLAGNAGAGNGGFTVALPPTWPDGSSLTASNVGQAGLTLTWTAAMDNVGVVGYRVYQDTALLATVAGTTTTYDVTGLTAITAYTFKVEVGDAAGNWTSDGPSTAVVTENLAGDLTGDGNIDFEDLMIFALAWRHRAGDAGWDATVGGVPGSPFSRADIGPAEGTPPDLVVNPDGVVNFEDLMILARMWNWAKSA